MKSKKVTLLLVFAMLFTNIGWNNILVPKAQAAMDNVLLEDDFEDGNYDGWNVLAGSSWEVKSGNLEFTNPGDEAILSGGDPSWTDYSYEAEMRIDNGYPGIAARMKDRENFYLFRYDPASKAVDLALRKNNNDEILQSASYNLAPGSWHNFKITLKGNTIQGFVDGHKLIEVYDDTFSSGTVGFRSKWQALAADDIVVRDERQIYSDFENEAMEPWTPNSGEWSVVDNVNNDVNNKAVQQQSKDVGWLISGSTSWDDYYVAADITPLSTDTGFGIAGRVQDESNYYSLNWNPTSSELELVKKVDGENTVLDRSSYSLIAQASYSFRIDFVGEQLTGYVNGEKVVEAKDAAIDNGAVGLWSMNEAYIDNVVSSEMTDPNEAEVLAHWKFDPDHTKSGTLESGDLVLSDIAQKGNDLRLMTVGDLTHSDTSKVLQWSEDDYHANKDVQSLLFNNTQDGPVQRYFETVESAPVNDEQFAHGYTMEFIYKLPAEFSRNTHSWMKIFNRQGTGGMIGKTQGETGLLGQLAVSNLKELQWTHYSTGLSYNPTSWSFSLDSVEDWYHIALVNDTNKTEVYVNGVTDFRNAPEEIKNFAGAVGKGWDIGASSQGNGEGARRFLAGNLEEARIVDRALPMDEWLIPNSLDRVPEYGNNEDLPLLQEEDNYNILFVPDIQKPIRYMPEIVDEQTKWITKNAEANNIVFTSFIGDIVDEHWKTEQWLAANKSFTYLDVANIPYMTIAGNHDYEYWWGGWSPYLDYFGKNRYADKPYYTNESPSGHSNYSIFKAGSYEYMIIGTDWRDDNYNADRAWIQKVLSEHKTTPTILISHETLEFQGEQSTEVQRTHRGQRNWDDFVKNNDQVFMTVGGHHHGAGYMVSQNAYGHDVLEVLVDYQSQYHGGNGWMRFAEFDEGGNQIHFHTFSPWVENMDEEDRTYFDMKNLIGEKDRFTYDFNFDERFSFSQPMYYVDSGSTETNQLPPGEKFGVNNTVTDQPLGLDPVTGKKWGYKTDGAPTQSDGSDPWTSVLSDNGGSGKGITYEFEVPNGQYDVVLGFRDPSNTSGRLQTVKINGNKALESYSPPNYNDEKLFETVVTNGVLSVVVTRDEASTADPIISWIKINGKQIPLEKIEFVQRELKLDLGASVEYGVTLTPEHTTDSDLIWSSSNEEIVTVNNGIITGKNIGTSDITVTNQDGTLQATGTVTVTMPITKKEKLADMIVEAKAFDETQYTPESWTVLDESLKRAEEIYQNDLVTLEQIAETEKQLQNAIDQLVLLSSVIPKWSEDGILLKTDVTSDSVELAWIAAEHADKYKVLVETENGATEAEVTISPLTEKVYSATITGLSPDTTYTFKVKAGNPYGEWTTDGPSLQVKTLQSEEIPGDNKGQDPVWTEDNQLVKVDAKSNYVVFTWTGVENADQYKVLFGSNNDLVVAENATITAINENLYSAKVTGLSPNTSYTFKVEAKGSEDAWTTEGPSLEINTKSAPGNEEDPDNGETPGDGDSSENGENNSEDIVEVTPALNNGLLKVSTESIEKVAQQGSLIVNVEQFDKDELLVRLSKSQATMLRQKGATVLVQGKEIQLKIPASNFVKGDQEVTIHVNKEKDEKDALSSVYDFSIIQGEEAINSFDSPVTLTFTVNGKVKDEDLVHVYYKNEQTGQWELIGGDYQNGKVTAITNHFSTFTVFESNKDVLSQKQPEKDKSEKDPKEDEENELPDTATNQFNLLLLGVVLLSFGFVIIFRRKA